MSRQLAFDRDGWEDYTSWQDKHILSGAGSRRIDEANRLVYLVTDTHIVILQARDHY